MYTYGELPPRVVFRDHYYLYVGSDPFEMRLVGADAEVWNRYGSGGDPTAIVLDEEELWDFVVELTEAFHDGSDAAGDLASSILYVLRIEWV